MRVLHFTDVHLPIPYLRIPAWSWFSKRALGGMNSWLRRRKKFRDAPRKLQELEAFARDEGVDLFLSTGDHTHLGTEPEYEQAARVLEPFRSAAHGLIHIPGNHDVYLVDAVRERRFERYFGEFQTDLPELAGRGAWPFVRLLGPDVAVVGVNSARPNAPFWRSSGRIAEAEVEALERVFADPRVSSRFVFVLTHYAPRLPSGEPDEPNHGLENADAFLAACSRLERGAVLHGHVHHCYFLRVPELRIPIFGAGSTTYAGREGFWVFDVGPEGASARKGSYQAGAYVLDPTRVSW
jgi:3',5'-cyclic AMP phosphodiesterase CpdA